MIVTARNKIPFLWQLTIAMPWGILRFKYMIIGAVFIFSLKKFIENPAGITFIMSIPTMLSLAVNPICSFMSDRIWTRWGRRKPFKVLSMFGVVASFVAMPLMPNVWGLMFAYFMYQLTHDFGLGATDTLKQEVVPPKQRGTATAIGQWINTLANLSFYLIALGRFDDFQYYAGFPITGEQSLYWGISALIFMMALLTMLGVYEVKQPSKFLGQKLTPKNFFGGLLDNKLWPVYLLITGWSVAHAGLGALGALLYTEQWGFSKQEMGINVAVGSLLNLFIFIPLIGLIADKVPRMLTFKILMVVSILIEVAYFVYIEFVLFDKTPTLPEVILFGEMGAVVGILLGMIYTPMVYDYVPRNEMGTFAAGSVLVGKIIQVITLNGVGVFVSVYAALFMPPGGDMTRIALSEKYEATAIQQIIDDSGQFTEDDLTVEAWYATNASFSDSHAFEVRRMNKNSLDLRNEIDEVNAELNGILAKKSNAEALAERLLLKADQTGIDDAKAKADEFATLAEPLEAKVAELEATQQADADTFKAKIDALLADKLMVEGTQVINAQTAPATIVRYALNSRPKSKDVANTLNQLRLIRPEVIDARLSNEQLDFYLDVSLQGELSDPSVIDALSNDLASVAEPRLGNSFTTAAPVSSEVAESIQLELKTIEDPLDNYTSPFTRFTYSVWDWFGDPPTKERRIWATARALRDSETSMHVGSWDQTSDGQHRILLQAIYAKAAELDPELEPSDNTLAAFSRFDELLGAAHPQLQNAKDLYQRSLGSASQNRITIPSPTLESGFAPPKYDYMSGYLWMIVMSTVGLMICLYFTRREEKGLIHKRGREEAEAEEAAEAEAKAKLAEQAEDGEEPENGFHEYYTPGYVPHKIGMTAIGIALILLGLVQLGPNIKLFFSGEKTTAIASKVVKERIGGTPITLNTDAEVIDAKESYDRSYIFWNYFEYEGANKETHEFRSDIGKQLSPHYSLLDDDGLPTSITVYYDAADPAKVLIPQSYSTWFVSGLLIVSGLLGAAFGLIILFKARTPIALPIVKPKDAPEGA